MPTILDSPDTSTLTSPSKTQEPTTSKGQFEPLSPQQTEPSNPENLSDSGPLNTEWAQELLIRYTTDLSKLDEQEQTILERLAAIQKLQLLWAIAGRIGEMDRSNKRIKTRTTKIMLEDERLSNKRRKLNGAMAALQNVVGMLDEVESTGERRVST